MQYFATFTPLGMYQGCAAHVLCRLLQLRLTRRRCRRRRCCSNATTTYSNFVAGPQPDSLFEIPDVDSCQKSPNCDTVTDPAIMALLPVRGAPSRRSARPDVAPHRSP